ncbi:MAG: hypothetical protein ACI4SH_02965 [Candidatus Scatosoma sp.]
MSYKAMAHIHSLNGEMAEITVLEEVGDNDYIVDYKGVKCHALFNWFVCEYYHWRLVNVGKNHYCFSAFIKSAENKCVYISISDVRYFSNEWYDHILIRTAENETDYRGGFNNYTSLQDLEGTAAYLLNDLPF